LSDDRLDEPNVGGALGLGFLGISSGSLASLDEVGGERRGRGEDTTKAKQTAERNATKTPMSVAELAKALLAELRGLEDRVEVAGDESGPMVLLKLGSALEAIRDEPFKSI
jgi:collagen type III alpha/collagen type V/XI/XXIV/XXVII alpha